MKKLSVVVLLSLLLVSSFGFVSAQSFGLDWRKVNTDGTYSSPIADSAKNFYNSVFEPFGKFLLGKNTDTGELFFAKLLFFLVLITLVNYALSQIEPLKSKAWFISAIVSILAVRWITPAWIETIVLPYTALGITLTAFFPFVIYFFFVEKGLGGYTTMRKVAWIFAAVIFVGLFIYRDTTQFPANSKDAFNPSNIYLITAGLCLIMLWLDGTIQRAFAKTRVSNMMDKHKYSVDYDTSVEYDKIIQSYHSHSNPSSIKSSSNSKIGTLNSRRKSVNLPEFNLIS